MQSQGRLFPRDPIPTILTKLAVSPAPWRSAQGEHWWGSQGGVPWGSAAGPEHGPASGPTPAEGSLAAAHSHFARGPYLGDTGQSGAVPVSEGHLSFLLSRP